MIILSSGGSRIFFRRGCTRLLLYFNTNKPHSFFFFLQNTSCIRKPQVISGGGGAHPLHPPPRTAPVIITYLKAFRGNMTLVDIIYWFNLRKIPNNNQTFRRSFQNQNCLVHLKSETVGHRLKNFKIAVMNYLFSRILSTTNFAFWKTNLSNNYLFRYYRRVFSW